MQTKTRWEKPYVGPFEKGEAAGLAAGLRETADPEMNLIHDAAVRRRPKQPGQYDVFIKVTKI